MTLSNRTELLEVLFSEALEVSKAKGAAYAGLDDALANFKDASRIGLTPFQRWADFADKHLSAIFNAIKQNPDYPVEKTESLHGRIVDAIVYLGILEALSVDLDPLSKISISRADIIMRATKHFDDTLAEYYSPHPVEPPDVPF